MISAGDAVTINAAEVRSSSEQHADATHLLEEVVRGAPAPVLREFGAVIQAKFEYEYAGEVFTQAAAKDCSSRPNGEAPRGLLRLTL